MFSRGSCNIGRSVKFVSVRMQELGHAVCPFIPCRATRRTVVCQMNSAFTHRSKLAGIVIRLVYGLPFRGTLAIAHDRKTNTTHAVCFGIAPEHSHLLLTRLEASQDYAFFPLHVAYLLTDIALTNLETFSSNTYSDFLSVREAMGTNLYFLPAQVSRTPDLSELPRRLTALANAAASNCSSLRGVGIIVDMLSTYLHNLHEDVVTCDDATACVYTDRFTLMKQVVESTLRRNEYLKESVQAQVQMVSSTMFISTPGRHLLA